jgi:hypothetical protein
MAGRVRYIETPNPLIDENRMRIGYWWESEKGKRSLRRPRCRWVDNRMNLEEVGWGGMD